MNSFNNFNIFTFLLIAPLAVSANSLSTEFTTATDSMSGTDIKTYFSSEYVSQDSRQNSGTLFQVKMGMALSQEILSTLKFDLNASLNLQAGSSDSLFNNSEIAAKNGVSFNRAEFIWLPTKYTEVKAGALNLGDLNHDLLLGSGAFVGVKETIQLNAGDFNLRASAFQAIPNNRNFSNKLEEIDEENPSFFLESININLGREELSVSSTTSHFAFANLSNSVAGQSLYLGNTIDSLDANNGEFVYSYIGWAQRLQGQIQYNAWTFAPFAEYVINDSAPVKNTATLFGLKNTFSKIDRDYSFILETFRSEADASVGFYNNLDYGHNNRTGSSVRFQYHSQKEDIDINLNFTQLKEIDKNQLDSQDEDQIIGITLRKSYDVF